MTIHESLLRRAVVAAILLLTVCRSAESQWNPPNHVTSYRQSANGIVFSMQTGFLHLQVCTPSIVRAVYAPTDTIPRSPDSMLVERTWAPVPLNLREQEDTVTLLTSALAISVVKSNGIIIFRDRNGNKLFEESGRLLTPVQINGEQLYHAEIFSNLWGSTEAFYGLGQHQSGVWNYRGEAVDLSHDNTNISIPLLLSSNGYGILWHNASRSRFNNRFPNALYLSAEAADAVDYFLIHGPAFDDIIAGYRLLTGQAPLFGKWAYGFWQCKNRYKSQEEILGIARAYRARHIPVDNIVQDWFWWCVMGEPVFDAQRYPDPKEMIDELHRNNFHLMVSFWPYFRPGSSTYAEMDRRGYFIDRLKVSGFHPAGMALYDAFNADARRYYWGLLDTALFRRGVDAWWLDTTEPETEGRETNILVTNKVAIGNGARFTNAFPLMTTSAVYQGQRSAGDDKRVFILSRSAFAGSQRNAAAVWSGDINGDWTVLKRQIPAGMNYALSGMPYWTTDIGGFLLGSTDDPAYRELFVRWFQFGTFCPIFRVHGTRTNDQNELWAYGADAEKTLVAFDRLRYRLLPYIYSLAWMTTDQAYTPMRPLVMDFRADVRAANTGDQFLFGPAVLVNPVTEPGALSRNVYLPAGDWFNFWDGTAITGGKMITAAAPLDRLPLFVRAGSIIPMGPDIEWSNQKPADPLELRIYEGADGEFTLYEDEGDTYRYEKRVYAVIPIHWNDRACTLTIADRKGRFPGMLASRTFNVVLVGKKHGTGIEPTGKPDASVKYTGQELSIELKRKRSRSH